LLPPDRSTDYLIRLAHNEPGLSRLLVKELRELNLDKTGATIPTGERVSYATLLAESTAIRERQEAESAAIREREEREERERRAAAYQRRLQELHDHQDTYWRQVDKDAARGSAAGYDDAVQLLSDLREAANRFQTSEEFQRRFSAWVQPHLRRPALVKRLQERKFSLP
jgi:hypothetical protein